VGFVYGQVDQVGITHCMTPVSHGVARRVGAVADRGDVTHHLFVFHSRQASFNALPPVSRIHTFRHQAPKRAVLPVGRRLHQPVLHRIVVNVIAMPVEIVLIAYGMLPETPLPNTGLTTPYHRRRYAAYGPLIPPAESSLDPAPPCRKIRIAVRECPHGVQMIRQHNNRVHLKGSQRPYGLDATS